MRGMVTAEPSPQAGCCRPLRNDLRFSCGDVPALSNSMFRSAPPERYPTAEPHAGGAVSCKRWLGGIDEKHPSIVTCQLVIWPSQREWLGSGAPSECALRFR